MRKNLSMFAVWGLSFGYAVGWGAFVMPGAAFLPDAGPLGTVLGILVGAAVMAVIGWNYHKMVSACPGPAGACRYAHEAFGSDYGYLTAWSLSLAYMAILWANATALVLLVVAQSEGALRLARFDAAPCALWGDSRDRPRRLARRS